VEKRIIARARQQYLAADVTAQQVYAEESADHIVVDALTGTDSAQYRSGFIVTQASVTEVNVAAGRYYEGGKRFIKEAAQTIDLLSKLPVATKKKVAIVAWGITEETDVQQRKFRVDPVQRTTEPDDVAMMLRRSAQVGVVEGSASSDPQLPTIDAGQLHFATVTLNTTGIEAIEMVESSRLKPLSEVEARVVQIEAWRAVAEPAISTLRSDLAALGEAMKGKPSAIQMDAALYNLAIINEKLDLDDAAVDYAADTFNDDTESDDAYSGYDAIIEEGIRSANDGSATSSLALFNSIDSTVSVVSGNMWPKYTEESRINVLDYSGEVAVSQYAAQEQTWVKKSTTRQRLRVGYRWVLGWPTRWWASTILGWASSVFYRAGDVWLLPTGVVRDPHPVSRWYVRNNWFWYDTVEDTRWEYITTETTKTGAIVSQTFLNAQSQVLTSIDLYFTTLGASGDVTVFLTETTAGSPDNDKTIGEATVTFANLKSNREVTKFAFNPVHLEAGKRYGIVIVTQGDHRLAMSDKGTYAGGTFFYSTDNAWFQGDLLKDLMFKVNFARFERTYLQVLMTPLDLSGGIQNLSLNYDKVLPDGTELWWEVQPAGTGPWLKIATDGGNAVFSTLPTTAQLRAVMVGTHDIMPMVRLTGSVVEVSRSKMGFTHISEVQTLGTSSDEIKIGYDLEGWDGAHQTATITLIDNTDTPVAADSVETITLGDGAVRKIATFTPAAPIPSFRRKIVTTTDDRKIQPVARSVAHWTY
jgi:hypothetical protein